MTNRRKRRWSLIGLVVIALGLGVIVTVAVRTTEPESVLRLRATVTWHDDGTATVHEVIDYRFPVSRHGIYRDIPGIPWTRTGDVRATADNTDMYTVKPDLDDVYARMAAEGLDQITVDPAEMTGVRVKIGDPDRTITGDHRYTIDYPLLDGVVADDRMGWNGVGTGWDVPVDEVELDVVAPWSWKNTSCDVGSSGSIGGCTVTQPEPGHLVVSYGRLLIRQGLTVYGDVDRELADTPAARPVTPPPTHGVWWRRPLSVGGTFAGAVLLAGLLTGFLLRRAGRDRVMGGPAAVGAVTELAFDAPVVTGRRGRHDGERRVDERRLVDWVGTEFVPPRELEAWQGGMIVTETDRPEQRVAWLLSAAAHGAVEIDESDAGVVALRRLDHPRDATTALLDVAFAGRDRIRLGSFDPAFSAFWSSLGRMQRSWLDRSPYVDHRGDGRVHLVRVLGAVGLFAIPIPGIVISIAFARWSKAVVVAAVVGTLLGVAWMLAVRAWELRVRTPAGTAMWLRIEAFRRFLAGSEAEHVREAASRGVLREYAAWAVALGEVDHWNAAVAAAGLPPTVPGVDASAIAGHLGHVCVSSTVSVSSGGSGGGSSGSSFSSGSGVGGGGGGGGGGSW